MLPLIILIVIVVLIVLFVVGLYNGLIQKRNRFHDAFSASTSSQPPTPHPEPVNAVMGYWTSSRTS
jgi:hypothetical protein